MVATHIILVMVMVRLNCLQLLMKVETHIGMMRMVQNITIADSNITRKYMEEIGLQIYMEPMAVSRRKLISHSVLDGIR